MSRNDQEYLIQKIRTAYTEREHTELDELKKLDRRVKAPASICAYTLGTLSALIMGSGMSLIMTDISKTLGILSPMLPGIIIGCAGMLLAAVNYPIYKKLLAGRRKKFAGEIIALSDKAMSC